MPLEYARLSSSQVSRIALEDRVLAVIPLGSIEQHCEGPLGLDSMVAETLAFRSCSLLEERGLGRCVILPTLYYGYSPEWSRVRGTISLPLDTYQSILEAIVEGLAKAGFRRVVFLNGHGGNSSVVEAVMRGVASRFEGLVLALVNYWELLDIKLDHAGPVEESIASSLGVAASLGDCREVGYMSRPRVTTQPPGEPSRIKFGGITAPRVEEVVEAVVRALEKVLLADPSSHSI